jgi:hypothetical protein
MPIGLNGKLLDARGRVGTIDVAVLDENEAAWKLQLSERDGQSVELEGKATIEGSLEKGFEMTAREEVPDVGVVEWSLRLEPADAGEYARLAMVGEYRVEGPEGVVPLTRGVLALWDFA